MMHTKVKVNLWGRMIGAAVLREDSYATQFQYVPEFVGSGIELSPLKMPLSNQIYSFPELAAGTFQGLPGMLADALPDRFGNALIHAWLARQGKAPESFNAIDRLCYMGTRGMGALEFEPDMRDYPLSATPLEISELVQIASEVLSTRGALKTNFENPNALHDILQVGTSAGGARAKAVIAWNPATSEIRSGQVHAPEGFEHWLIKFDGVQGNKDKEAEDPSGFGVVEYAYYQMARAAKIAMSECRLHEDKDCRHFMTRRFDRLPGNQKVHAQSLGALAHLDFNQSGANSYEQAFGCIRKMNLPAKTTEELFRRMAFNIVARNQDDHVKNIAFLMDKHGYWQLAPAFDVTYSYNLKGLWTAQHQMSMNGKRDHFVRQDFRECAKLALLKRGQADAILDEVILSVSTWEEIANRLNIPDAWVIKIKQAHRLLF